MRGILIVTALALNGASDVPSMPDKDQAERRIIEEAAVLSTNRQLAIYLGEAQSRSSEARRYSEEARVARLAADPALEAHFDAIRDEWFEGSLTEWRPEAPLFGDLKELVQLKIMIARNLFFQGLAPNPEAVRAEYLRIQDLRDGFRNLPVFAGRDVIYVASKDRARIGGQLDFLFGHSPTQARLRRQAQRFTFYRPSRSGDGKVLSEQLVTSAHPTLVFEGHGRDRALKIGGSLSVEDLSRRLSARRSQSLAILVLDACQSHTFSRHLLRRLREGRSSAALPVVITPEEYGQDFIKSVYSDRFLSRDLGLGRGAVRLGRLMEDAWITTSVYVPAPGGHPAQIL